MSNAVRRRPGCVAWIVAGYLAFAVYAWWDFTRINHDGLANLGLFLVTAPVTVVDIVMTANGWGTLQPHGHGYLADHALYYVPAVLVTALLLAALGRVLRRLIRKAQREDSEQ